VPGRPFQPNEVSAGGAVVRRGPAGYEVCLISDGRYWGLPKGNVERGEEPVQTAMREIAEETGISAPLVLIDTLPAAEYVYRREGRLIFKRVHHFLFEAPAGSELHPDPAEIAAAEWVSFDEAVARSRFRDTKEALAAARRILERSAMADPGATRIV